VDDGERTLEILRTCRSMRHLRPDPVPEPLLRRVLEAATWAPSPGNSQGWELVVVREAPRRQRLARAVREAVAPALPPPEAVPDAARRRMLRGAHHLLEHLEAAPVWVLVGGRPVYPPGDPSEDWIGAACWPAVQNLLLAARALGLGAALTTYHQRAEARVRAETGVPDDLHLVATILLGWPARPFGPVARRPLEEVLHRERWQRP